MYAVIKTGGKQHRVAEGSLLDIEKLPQDAGARVVFEQVLAVGSGESITIGTPLVSGASVSAKVVKQFRDSKVRIIKMKRRKHHMKRMGHRQYLTRIRVEEIKA